MDPQRAKFYPYNEVYVVSPKSKSGYVRLDSYNPDLGEIVSRKHTQLAEIHEETAIKYLEELNNKYSPGSKIADVPSNKTGANKNIFEENGGDKLKGQMILEVLVQTNKIPQKVLDFATQNKIRIRDINNKFYN